MTRAIVLAALAGCYQPVALDARTVMRELASQQREVGRDGAKGGAPVPEHPLTEEEAVTLALRWNQDLRAARRQRGVAEGDLIAARTLSNPTVDVLAMHLQDWGHRRALSLELGWEPPQPGIFSARRAAARAAAAAVQAEIAEAELQTAMAVREAHASLLALGQQRVFVEQGIEVRRRLAELVARRVAGGAGTRIDESLAGLAVTQRERERDNLVAQEIAARAQLGRVVGSPGPLAATGAIPEPTAPPPDLEALLEEAVAARPALAAGERRYLQRGETVRLEYARAWPWFRILAAPRYRYDGADTQPNDYALGLRLTLPVFDQNLGPIVAARASLDMEREQFKKLVAGIRRGLAATRETILARQDTLRRYRDVILPGLTGYEQALATATQGGQLNLVALLGAADDILRTRRDHVDFVLAHYRAWIDLERTAGRLPARDRP